MTRLFARPFMALMAVALAGCTQQAEQQTAQPTTSTAPSGPQIDAESGLQIIPVTVTTDAGSHVFQTEVAATPQEKNRGMMFRTEMGADEAMLFPYEAPRDLGFWMRNTLIPLDIIFVAEDGTIINIADGVPYNEESVFSDGPAIAVLELSGGRSEELGIGPGDKVEW